MACDFRITKCPSSKLVRFYSSNKDTSFVVAIDLGTAYSGYCYYCKYKTEIRSHCNNDLTSNIQTAEIMNPTWLACGDDSTPKTPTCILFDEQGTFVAFGYNAQRTYKRKDQSNKHFFKNFKMQLYNREIHRNMKISDSKGRKMEAMKVFSESLRYLKDHALEEISDDISASDVTWVLTLPAIWEPAAKQFMREAATQGGLVTETDSSRLIIALEPEAASVWCKQLPSDGFISAGLGNEILEQKPGTQYIVVDCGGGTVDMTVHEVLKDGFLKELHKASGNDMGGGSVDAKFKNLLKDIFGSAFWDSYEKEHPSEVHRIMLDFSLFKRDLKHIYIPCPHNLISLAEKKQKMSLFFKDVERVSWSDDDIIISVLKLKELFRESVDKIVQDIGAILDTPTLDISYILLVGGYASSRILQNEVKEQFGRKCKILCPKGAQLAVAKGAIVFGVTPMIVVSRVSARTYGIDVVRTFVESEHKKEKRRKNKAEDFVYCDDLFEKLVQNGESVFCEKAVEYKFVPINSDQTAMAFRFYSTEKPDAKYVDEDGMKQIGQFTVNMPDISKGRDRRVKLEISFGLTEIEATATDMTSNEQESVMLEFMTQ